MQQPDSPAAPNTAPSAGPPSPADDEFVTRWTQPSKPAAIVLLLLVLAGLTMSGVLAWQSATSGKALPGCGAGSGCDAVLNGPYATALGVPVAIAAVATYLVALGLWWPTCGKSVSGSSGGPRQAWSAWLVVVVLLAGAAAYFIGLQALVIGQWCKYCLITHSIGIAIALWTALHAPVGKLRLLPDSPPDAVMITPAKACTIMVLSVLPIVAIGLTQWQLPDRPQTTTRLGGGQDHDTGPGADRRLTVLAGAVALSPHELPMLGSPDAKTIIVELFDFNCPHCKELSAWLDTAMAQLPDDELGVVAAVVPLNPRCNHAVDYEQPYFAKSCEVARLALAVYRADASQYPAMHRALFAMEQPIDVALARQAAERLVGAAALSKAMADPWVDQRLKAHAGLYEVAGNLSGATVLPQMLIGRTIVRGRPHDEAEFRRILTDDAGLPLP